MDLSNSSEKSGMLHHTPPPPAAYPDNQGPYAQGPYSGQIVVPMQPAGNLTFTPLANPEPDHLCYSIFTMMCCYCSFMGIAAMIFSTSTRNANYSGQRALAVENSKMARKLNHVAVVLGIIVFVLFMIIEFVLEKE